MVRQPNRRISHVANSEDHGVNIKFGQLISGLARDGAVTLGKNIFRHRQTIDPT